MSIRTDVDILWELTPDRIFTVDSPSTALTAQDLHDSATNLEQQPTNLDDEKVIDSAGKEDLGGGTSVGQTSTLRTLRVAFDSGILQPSEGAVTTPDSTGITLTDSGANFTSEGVVPGDTVINMTDKSAGTVITVGTVSLTLLRALRGGSDNQWDSSDEYAVFTNVQMELSGGNVVGTDGNGDSQEVIFPTAFTQVIRTSASSATLSEGSGASASEVADAVWDELISGHVVAGSFGQYIGKKLLTFAKWFALKS